MPVTADIDPREQLCHSPKKLPKAKQLSHPPSPTCFTAASAQLDNAPDLCLGYPCPPSVTGWGKRPPAQIQLGFSTSWGRLRGCLRSAKIIPATLGKSPGCEFFTLKMQNWGRYSYYACLNARSLKIIYIHFIYIQGKDQEAAGQADWEAG